VLRIHIYIVQRSFQVFIIDYWNIAKNGSKKNAATINTYIRKEERSQTN
jgi:hypothetical protein